MNEVEAVARVIAPMMEGGREFDQMPPTRLELRQWSRSGMCSTNDATAIVSLRNALPELIAALEALALVRDEDWLAERISDTLDVDWRPIDAARAIIAALPKEEV